MEFGVHLPHVGPLGNRETLTAFARKAEELGFHSLWVSDHVVIPRQISGEYPGGRFPVPPEMPFLEPISTLLFVSAVTERIRLGTSILVLPMRHPVITAKELATLDVLSGGRLIFGAGTGWMSEEFEALNVPFRNHGPRMDDYLEVVRRCWTEEHPAFEGRFYKLPDVGFAPKPSQKPHPPIWVGGSAEGALRRAGRFADAWHATGMQTPEVIAERFAKVKSYAKEYGRDAEKLSLSVRVDGLARGEAGEVVERLRPYGEAGVSHMLVAFFAATLEGMVGEMEGFASGVMGRV
ncbi:MAG: LLM class F420-dependent oxidoreductase [Chloroflexi bacterium]|nr:LLM class F420-dependent oxidoreductase [Chloroflexota bacterium]